MHPIQPDDFSIAAIIVNIQLFVVGGGFFFFFKITCREHGQRYETQPAGVPAIRSLA